MIEQAMFFSLGFLVSALVALAVAPAFWHRAIRLATRRLEMLLPLSAREVLAGRDLLRAELAVERRKLEQKVEALSVAHARDMAELGRRTVALAGSDAKVATLSEQLTSREAENDDLRLALAEARRALETTTGELHEASARCEQTDAEVDHLRRHLEVLQKLCANQRVALTVLERDLVHEREERTVETVRVARLADELSNLRIEYDAALVRLDAATAGVVEMARIDPPAEMREPDQRAASLDEKPASTDSDNSLRREIDRLVADLMAYGEAEGSDAMTRETGAASSRTMADKRMILRKRISDIGTAAIHLAGAEKSAAPKQQSSEEQASIVATNSKV